MLPGQQFTFNQAISSTIGNDVVTIAGQTDQSYDSIEQYLQLQSNPNAYADHILVCAAEQVYNITVRITYGSQPYPSPPAQANVCDVHYNPVTMHYTTLQYS